MIGGLAGLLMLKPEIDAPWTQLFRPTLSCVFFASCMVLAVTRGARVLRHPILARIARYSYAMYVFHLLIGIWIFSIAVSLGLPGRTVALPLAAFGVYGLAACSWKWIEAPALRLGHRCLIAQDRVASTSRYSFTTIVAAIVQLVMFTPQLFQVRSIRSLSGRVQAWGRRRTCVGSK